MAERGEHHEHTEEPKHPEHHGEHKDHPETHPGGGGEGPLDPRKISGGGHDKDVPTSIDDPIIHTPSSARPKAAAGVPEYRLEVVPGPADHAVEAARLLGNGPDRPLEAAVGDPIPMQAVLGPNGIYGPGPPMNDYMPAPAVPANMQGVGVGPGNAPGGGIRDRIKDHWKKIVGVSILLAGGASAIGLWQAGVFGGGTKEKDSPTLGPIPAGTQDIAGGARGPVTLTILPDHGTDGTDQIDPGTLTLYASREEAMNHTGGGKTISQPGGGTWTVLTGTDEGKVSFAPDAALTGDPAPVYVAVQDMGGLWSNVVALNVVYTDSGKATTPVSPMTLAALSAKITQFASGAEIDPKPAVTANGATPDYSSLKLVDASGAETGSVIVNTGADDYSFRVTDGTDRTIVFERATSAVPTTITTQFTLYDTDGKRAAPASLSVEIIRAPRGEMIVVDTFQHLPTSQNQKTVTTATPIDIDVMSKVTAITDNQGLSLKADSLLLKSVTDMSGGTAPAVTFEGEVEQTTPYRWGYTKATVAGEGVWEIIDQNGTSALRFTRDPAFVGYPAAMNLSVTDANGYESNTFSVVLNADVEEIAKGIRSVVRGPAAAFWSAFEGALAPSIATPGATNPPFEDFYNMLVFLETALASGFTSTADATKAQGILVAGNIVTGLNQSWGLTGDAGQLITLARQTVTAASTGEGEDSLFLRYAQINLMRRVARYYFVTLAQLG